MVVAYRALDREICQIEVLSEQRPYIYCRGYDREVMGGLGVANTGSDIDVQVFISD